MTADSDSRCAQMTAWGSGIRKRTLRPDEPGPPDSRGRLSPHESGQRERKQIPRFARDDSGQRSPRFARNDNVFFMAGMTLSLLAAFARDSSMRNRRG